MKNNEISLSDLNKGLSIIHFLFVAFGAIVLVHLLIGIDPAIALFTAGISTLIFISLPVVKYRFSWEAVSLLLPRLLRQRDYTAILVHFPAI